MVSLRELQHLEFQYIQKIKYITKNYEDVITYLNSVVSDQKALIAEYKLLNPSVWTLDPILEYPCSDSDSY